MSQPEQASSAPANDAAAVPRSSSRWDRTAWELAALAPLVLAVYVPALSADFVWDDDENVVTNQTLRSPDGLRQMWFVPGATQQYYPLMYTSYWLEYHLWGLDPLGYHLLNMLLHAAAAVLFWRLLLQLEVPGAFLAAAIFAVHPVMVESVAWITERKNVLSLVLALLAMLAYLRFAPPQETSGKESPARWRWYALALALFALALTAKTVVVTLPFVLLVIYWWKRGTIHARDVMRLAPFFALSVAMGCVTMLMETHYVGARGEEWSLSPVERLLLAGRALWFYAGKLAWPYPIVFFYPRWRIDAHVWWQYLFPAAAIVLPIALWLLSGRIGRGPLAAVLIFAGVLVPALGFFNVYYMRYAYVSDHFQYHASVALVALAAAGATTVAARLQAQGRGAAKFAAATVVAVLAALTFQQTRIYANLETLYRDTIAKNPDGWLPYSNLAAYLISIGKCEDAVVVSRDALRLNPGDPTVHNNLGESLLACGNRDGFSPGQLEEVVGELRTALELSHKRWRLTPGEAGLRNDLGSSLLRLHNRDDLPQLLDEAILHLSEAVRLSPNLADARKNLAFALLAANRPAEAMAAFSQALRSEPEEADLLFGMATALARSGDVGAAAEYYNRALAENADYAEAHHGLALALINLGQPDDAERHLEEALRINPAMADAHHDLGGILANRGQLEMSAGHYRAAIELQPSHARALNNLGVVLGSLGETDEAIRCFQEAIRQNPGYDDAKANLHRALDPESSESPK